MFEGEIKGGGADRLNVLTFGNVTLKTYTPGTTMTVDVPSESQGQLIVDQRKAYYFRIDDVLKFQSYVANPESGLIQNAGKVLAEEIDRFILGHHTKVAAGQRIGTPYTTGTVAVTANTGVVTGTGTTFTPSMVGLGFKAAGHTAWYRIKSYSSPTSITIEDDKDDEPSAYTGGAIASGSSYVIEAANAVQITSTNIYDMILQLKQKLDEAKIPQTDRYLVINSAVARVLLKATELIPAVPTAYENVVLKGILGTILGFKVYQNEQVRSSTGADGASGYWVLAGHKSAICFAMAFTESGVEDVPGQFAKAYKGLSVFGAKVLDERRKALASLFCKL